MADSASLCVVFKTQTASWQCVYVELFFTQNSCILWCVLYDIFPKITFKKNAKHRLAYSIAIYLMY